MLVGYYLLVNCAPAKGCVWPVAAPARAWVRAGGERRGAAFLLRRRGLSSLKGEVFPCASRFAPDHACREFLLEGFAPVLRPPCGSVGTSGVRLTPILQFLLPRLAFDHACLFSFVRKRETACGMLRFYSAVGRNRL